DLAGLCTQVPERADRLTLPQKRHLVRRRRANLQHQIRPRVDLFGGIGYARAGALVADVGEARTLTRAPLHEAAVSALGKQRNALRSQPDAILVRLLGWNADIHRLISPLLTGG